MSSTFPHLFQPIRIGTKQSRNRIMRVGTSTRTCENGVASERTIAFYRKIAQGGTGTVIIEGMRAHGSSAASRAQGFLAYRKEIVPGLQQMAQAVHEEGALLIGQLNHGGRQHQDTAIPAVMLAPSAIACPSSGGVPHELGKAEVADLAAGYVLSALHTQQGGCDGVEIHGAQGHLIHEFISPFSNQRTDEYGGSFENRMRFVSEIILAVRKQAGPDFIIGYRMGVDEFSPGGIDVEASKEITRHLLKLGAIDYLSLSQGNHNSMDAHLPDAHYAPMPFMDLQARIKAVAGDVPVVGCTRIQTPEQAEFLLTQGKADMVGLCRALVADPEWSLKAQQGRSKDIRRCISTNACWSAGRITCTVNAELGFELEMPPLAKVATPKRIVVVGGGPAGMEAARVAAERGHHVVLFEKKAVLGGKLAGSGRYAGYHEAWFAIEDLSHQLNKSGANLRLGIAADARTVMAERPDAVIVASGATVLTPKLAGDASIPVFSYDGDLPQNFPDGDVAVMDEDGFFWAMCVTEQLARQGRKVFYITRFFEPLRELPKVSRISTLRALDKLGVACHPTMYVDRAEKGELVVRHYFNQEREMRLANVNAVVWLGPQRVNDSLVGELRSQGMKDVRVVGDAFSPRRLGHAIAEGHRAARAV